MQVPTWLSDYSATCCTCTRKQMAKCRGYARRSTRRRRVPVAADRGQLLCLGSTPLTCRCVRPGVSVAVIIAVAINTDGRSEVELSEAEPFWSSFPRSLTRRGLPDVKLVISDAHEGLKKAAAKALSVQLARCRVHFMSNALATPALQRQMVAAAIRTASPRRHRRLRPRSGAPSRAQEILSKPGNSYSHMAIL